MVCLDDLSRQSEDHYRVASLAKPRRAWVHSARHQLRFLELRYPL